VSGGEERDKTLVQDLIDFHTKIDQIVEKSFHNNSDFIYCEKVQIALSHSTCIEGIWQKNPPKDNNK